mgnify:CR=1 FL=1
MAGTLAVTGDASADRLLNNDPLALMIGMLLDQQIAIELAFVGPSRLAQRLGGSLDAHQIAAMDPEEFVEICRTKPALHRFPAPEGARLPPFPPPCSGAPSLSADMSLFSLI